MDDDAFLDAFTSGALRDHGFGHRDHLRMAWLYVRRYGQDEALRRADAGLRALAASHGHPERYSATRTAVWVALVAHHLEEAPGLGFEAFLARFPRLLDGRARRPLLPRVAGQRGEPGPLGRPDRLPRRRLFLGEPMCRLFGLHAGAAEVAATFWLIDAPDSLAAQSHHNPDGAGVGAFGADGKATVSKQPIAAWEDTQFAAAAHDLRGTTFVAHVRYASTGDHTLANTHPFEQDGRLFAHNGVVQGLTELDRRLADLGAAGLVGGETDSERVFALITAETRRVAATWPKASPRRSAGSANDCPSTLSTWC